MTASARHPKPPVQHARNFRAIACLRAQHQLSGPTETRCAEGNLASQVAAAAMVMALAAAPAVATAQTFEIRPAGSVFAGQPLDIELRGLDAGSRVTIDARRALRDWRGRGAYGASATYTVPADGRLDLATAVPLAGSSYEGADGLGLFWSMRPLDASSDVTAWRDGVVRLVARSATKVLATQTVRLERTAPGLTYREGTGLPGARLYGVPAAAPAASGSVTGKRPVVIVLGGSEGGASVVRSVAATLASNGLPALALPYYSPPGYGPQGPTPPEVPALPATFTGIPIERVAEARSWLAAQPDIDTDRIAVWGMSKGAEFALIAATKYPWLKAVAAIVPSDVVWEGWGDAVAPDSRSSFSWNGADLPWVPYQGFAEEFAGFQTGRPVIVRRPQDAGRAAHPERVPAARIPVEAFRGPVLLAGADGDQVWNSGGMAQQIADTRRAAGLPTELLRFPDAGHAIWGDGWSPTTQLNAGPMQVGGTLQANAQAQRATVTATVEFLKQALGR